jgi:iron complex outermembrane receptor protein
MSNLTSPHNFSLKHQNQAPTIRLRPLVLALQAGFVGLLVGAAARAADPAEASQPAVMPLVSVTGQESAAGPVTGYVARRSATGTKTDTPILETPQSISVIGADQIETLRATSINDAIAYSVGALRLPYGERTGDAVMLRGFMVPMTLRDGTMYQTNRFDGQQEPYGLERIEVLKGASSILYGATEPGGVLNTVSKRPSADPVRELHAEIGSFARKQVAADIGGALSADGAWTYRLTGLKRDSGTFTDHIPDNRTYIAPALKWQISGATSLTLLSEYQRDRSAYSSDGFPTVGTVLPNVHGPIPRSRFIGEPGYDRYQIARFSLGYLFEHAFSDKLKLSHSLRRYHMEQDWSSISGSLGFAADNRTLLARSGEDRREDNSQLTSDTTVQYDWQAGGIAHTSLAGLDYSERAWHTGRFNREVAALDLYAPVYGGAIGPARPGSGWNADTRQIGLYVQDQMKIAGNWVLLLGGRQDRVRETECSYFTPSNCYTQDERTKAFTGRAGLVYLAANGVAPFASFSQSFAPQSGINRLGERFKPTRGEQIEAGIRYQPAGAPLLLSAAVYNLTKSNVLTDDPADPGYQSQQGELRSRGVELEAKGQIGRHAQIIGSYTYTDARVTDAGPLHPEQLHMRTAGVPYNQFSLWADYHFGAYGMPGLKVGGGGRYVGETNSMWHEVRAPDYTVFDAMISYSSGPWRLALNLSNLADKKYVASCPYRCFYGEPRKAIASLTYRW